jgi:hypothetical protein
MRTKNTFLTIILITIIHLVNAQITLNGGIKIVISGGLVASPIFVVLDAPPATPITTSGTTDGIIMENEYNRLQYNLSTGTTAITVPYMSSALESMPVTVSSITGGTNAAGNIRFSTKKAATRSTGYDNSVYPPSDVTNLYSYVGGTNNSSKVIDRFWIIDANGYGTKPAVTLSFTYIDAEWATNGGNSITEANLRAQRFNSTSSSWNFFGPAGSINTATNIVSSVTVPATDFFRSWTLVDNTSPLPIELIKFSTICKGKNVEVNWTTASESNNYYFTVEKSNDGISFAEIGIVHGSGTSSTRIDYSFTDYNSNNSIAYYRLKQTDFDGAFKYFNASFAENCNSNLTNVNAFNDQQGNVVVTINSVMNDNYTIMLYDALGQKIINKQYAIENGTNEIKIDVSKINSGIYFISMDNGKTKTTKRVFIKSN